MRPKLTNEQVIEICERLLAGEKHVDIVNDYNITVSTISQILHNRVYRNITKNYDFSDVIKHRNQSSRRPEEFIYFIIYSIKNNMSVKEIFNDPRNEINDIQRLYDFVSCVRLGRIYKSKAAAILNIEDIVDPVNREYLSDDTLKSITEEIRNNPKISNKKIYEKYNVDPGIVSCIRRGVRYADITKIKHNEYILKTPLKLSKVR
jgi:hypothetical protein